MIRVQRQPEPATFDELVRRPGRQFLRQHPAPTTKQWRNRAYWTRILSNLHDAYCGVCAYSCHWIPFDTGHDTVEHFRPKNVFPRQAYEWSNYRLVCGTLNGRKGTDLNVLDPFEVQDDWFVLNFPSGQVHPSPALSRQRVGRVLHTIKQLGLNDEGTCLKARLRYVKCFCVEEVTFAHLVSEAPFIAREIQRQGLQNTLPAIMGY